MTSFRPGRQRRRGVAIVEFAFILPILVVVLLGVWEIGRMIQVQQVLKNAAREGARVAAQGFIINDAGAPTEIHANTGSPNVEATVRNYPREAGINTDGLQVRFSFVGTTRVSEPYQGVKGQAFRVEVKLPFNNVRWTLLGLTNITELGANVTWRSLVDDPFTLDTNIPSW